MRQDDSLINDFLQESRDHLASIESDLLSLEDAGAEVDDQLVNQVFRAAHSIKGGAGFFSLDAIQKLAHSLENALDMVRNKEMVPTPEVVNILLLGFDRLREMINNPPASEGMEIEDLVVALTGLATSHLPEAEKRTLATTVPLPAPPGQTRLVHLSEFDLKHAAKRGKNIFVLDLDLLQEAEGKGKSPWFIFKELMSCGTVLDCAWDLDAMGTLDDEITNSIPLQILYSTALESNLITTLVGIPGDQIMAVPVGPPPPAPKPVLPAPALSAPIKEPAKPAVQSNSAESVSARAPIGNESPVGETTLRVSLTVLEQLMDLAGEMVLGRNQLMEAISRQDSRAILAGAQRINFVTSELQEAIMLTRMQPIGNVLSRFPRVVRDMSREVTTTLPQRVVWCARLY